MKNKKFLIVLFSICLIAMTALFVSCGDGDSASSDSYGSDDTGSKTKISLSIDKLTLARYSDYTLTVKYTGEGEVVWSSSDERIATVENGYVVALNNGETVITAAVGEAKAECMVSVNETEGLAPVLCVSDETAINIFNSSDYELTPYVLFDGRKYQAESLSFESSDKNVADVDKNGKVTAKAYGTADITVTGNWRGVSSDVLAAVVSFKVIPDVSIIVKNAEGVSIESVAVYSLSELDGQTFKNSESFTVTVEDNRNAIENPDVKWTIADGGENLITLKNGVLQSEGIAGETTITASATVNGEVYSTQPIKVEVLKPVVEKQINKDADLYKQKFASDFSDIFTDGKAIVDICDVTGDKFDIGYTADGETDFSNSGITPGERKWVVYNDAYGYEINVIAASIVIRSANDFVDMYDATCKGVWKYEGYIILDSDIDFAGFDYNSAKKASTWWSNRGSASSAGFFINTTLGNAEEYGGVTAAVTRWLGRADGFTGTFDGRGHIVKNLSVELYGLFPNIKEGSVFKNVAFVNADVKTSSAVISSAVEGTVENVYIEVSADNTWLSIGYIGGVTMALGSTAKLKNVVVAANFTSPDKTREDGAKTVSECGAIAAAYKNGATLENVYAIANAGGLFGTYTTNIGGDGYNGSLKAYTEVTSEIKPAGGFVGFDDKYWNTNDIFPIFKNAIDFTADKTMVVAGGNDNVIKISSASAYADFELANVPENLAGYLTLDKDGKTATVTVSPEIISEIAVNGRASFTVRVKYRGTSSAIKEQEIQIVRFNEIDGLTVTKGTANGAGFATGETGLTSADETAYLTVLAGGITINGEDLDGYRVKYDFAKKILYVEKIDGEFEKGSLLALKAGTIFSLGEQGFAVSSDFEQIMVGDGNGLDSGDWCAIENLAIDCGNWGSAGQVRFHHSDLGLAEGTEGRIVSGQVLKNGVAFTDYSHVKYGTDNSTRFEYNFGDYDVVTVKAGLIVNYGSACYRFTNDYSLVNLPVVQNAPNAGGCLGYGGGTWATPWTVNKMSAWGNGSRIQFNCSQIPAPDGTLNNGEVNAYTQNVYSDWVTGKSSVVLIRNGEEIALNSSTDYQIWYHSSAQFGTSFSISMLSGSSIKFVEGDIVKVKKGTVISFKVNGVDMFFAITEDVSQINVGSEKGIWGGDWYFLEEVTVTRAAWGNTAQVRFNHEEIDASGTGTIMNSGYLFKNGEAFVPTNVIYFPEPNNNSTFSTGFEGTFAEGDVITIKAGLLIKYNDKCYRFTNTFSLKNMGAGNGDAWGDWKPCDNPEGI